MEYLIFGSILLILVIIILQRSKKISTKNELDKLERDWGKPKPKVEFHFAMVSKYAETMKSEFHRLTDQTIEDIDFHQLFKFIDRTTSKVGQQFLYKKAIEPINATENPSEKLVEFFSTNKDLREKVQLQLLKLNKHDAYHIASLLGTIPLKTPAWLPLLVLDLLTIVGIVIASFWTPVLLVFLIIPFTLNMALHLWNKNNTFHFSWSIPQLNILINVSKELMAIDKLFYSKSAEESAAKLKSFQQKASFIRFSEGDLQSEISQYLFDLIKAFLLIEIFMIFRIIKELKDKQVSIATLFEYVGNIDASISIASLRAGKLKTCKPIFLPASKEMQIKGVYHPLIKDCVKNDLTIGNKSILITGSNMSGKSTFLRTLTINSILAQTLYTCFAEEYRSPILKQFSSIRIDDNLFEGKSYYFQEVHTIGSLLTESEQPNQNLFVLDEVFKGTNTIERIAAAKAVLSYLNRNTNIVVVSTHDIELAEMLAEEYDLYHFTETIESDTLQFDHKLKFGQLQTRNAIKLLELADYPTDIIEEAKKISSAISESKTTFTSKVKDS